MKAIYYAPSQNLGRASTFFMQGGDNRGGKLNRKFMVSNDEWDKTKK